MKKTILAIAVTSTLQIMTFAAQSERTIQGVKADAIERALHLPANLGPFARESGRFTAYENGLEKKPLLTRRSEVRQKFPESLPDTSWCGRLFTVYGDHSAPATNFRFTITFYDAPSFVDGWHYHQWTSGGQRVEELPSGSWSGRKLGGETWHFGEIGKATGEVILELSSNGVSIEISFGKFSEPKPSGNAALDHDPRFKGFRAPLPMTKDEADNIEYLAKRTLKYALEFRARGYK